MDDTTKQEPTVVAGGVSNDAVSTDNTTSTMPKMEEEESSAATPPAPAETESGSSDDTSMAGVSGGSVQDMGVTESSDVTGTDESTESTPGPEPVAETTDEPSDGSMSGGASA